MKWRTWQAVGGNGVHVTPNVTWQVASDWLAAGSWQLAVLVVVQ
jgi:hypothetical protein